MFYRAESSTTSDGLRSKSFFLRRFIASRTSVLQLFFSLILIISPVNTAFSSEFELLHIASELNLASKGLAKEQGYSDGFTGISHRASSLARESLQLMDAIQRKRNPSNIRSQFNDVSRRYTDLEDAFWRGYRNNPDKAVFKQLEAISIIYSDLITAYTATRYFQSAPQIHIFVPPRAIENELFTPALLFDSPVRP